MAMEIDHDLIVLCDGGVKKKIITQGNGDKPPIGAEVKVHYVGTLLDGSVFDSSRSRNDAFIFKLGEGKVIKGWDEGVATMSIGEKSLLICSPEYAYGKNGSPPKIPPNATLQFEVELLEYNDKENVTDDGGVRKTIKKKGEGYQKPSDDTTVHYRYKLSIKNNNNEIILIDNYWDTESKLLLGDDPSIPAGIEEALKSMYKGEYSIFFISSEYGYGNSGRLSDNKIPPNTSLIVEIELLSFDKAKETWDMNIEEKILYMQRCRDQGNKFFKVGQIKKAGKKYSAAIKVFQYEKSLSPEDEKKINDIKLICHSNAATCKYKEKNWDKLLSHANDGLKIDNNHLKCLFKRAQANAALDYIIEADQDFQRCFLLDGGKDNKEIIKEYQLFKEKQKKLKEKERKTFGGFFNKVHLFDENEEKKIAQENITKSQMDIDNNNTTQASA